VRRGITALVVAGALLLPASALATSALWTGDFAGDTSTDFSLIFSAKGKVNKKGKFQTRRVSAFDVAVQFSCFDAAGNTTSSARRDDLAPGFPAGLKVSKKGRFAGTATIPAGLTYTAAGTLRKGKGSGTMQITQGTKGTAGYCSTGTFADPTVSWKAKLIPPVCGGAAPAAGRVYRTCVGP
jgi:hypothetical protein